MATFDEASQQSIDAAHALIKAVNSMGFDEKAFVETITTSHRTLQQSAMRAFVACIQEWAKQDDFDLRNQRTIEISKRIVAIFGDELYFTLI